MSEVGTEVDGFGDFCQEVVLYIQVGEQGAVLQKLWVVSRTEQKERPLLEGTSGCCEPNYSVEVGWQSFLVGPRLLPTH